ncbi:chemotaxis protein CheC [Azospirillum halopraeferens]|uniref:chemotaxis protein CheC n=1 Tax=Azospirillum halopraeferens TaxID=34010 RepID=UPI00041AB4E3|nr:chemotaxis protein CheC [Azospirillum halopraeferens]
MTPLSDIERDALTELANIGVSRASVALSRMIGDDVSMSVPAVDIVPRDDAARLLSSELAERLVAVAERFDGALSGSALLVFPERNSLELVRAALPDGIDLDHVFELEQEALCEIGNIVLNNCLSVIANLLGIRLETALPRVIYGNAGEIFTRCGVSNDPNAVAVVFYIRFHLRTANLVGQIVIALDVASADELRARTAGYVARITGAGAP